VTATADSLRYIASSTTWLAHHRDAEEAFDELEHICALVDTAIDTRPAQVYAGPCDICRRDMYAKEGASDVECRLCHLTYPMDTRREYLLELVGDQLATAAMLSAALATLGEPVTPDAIRAWATRGRLTAKGKDHRGRPTYRVEDVRRLAATMKRRGGKAA
jgi:hypothetical protein